MDEELGGLLDGWRDRCVVNGLLSKQLDMWVGWIRCVGVEDEEEDTCEKLSFGVFHFFHFFAHPQISRF